MPKGRQKVGFGKHGWGCGEGAGGLLPQRWGLLVVTKMRLRRRVEFVKFSEDVYSSVLDELVVLS